MSTQPRFAPTRRTVLRTAAWTAPAVSIAVAAPAYATGSTVVTPVPEATGLTVIKGASNTLRLSTGLPLGAGTHVVSAVVSMTFTGQNKEFAVQGSTVPSPWTANTVWTFSTATLTSDGLFNPVFQLSNSSYKSVQVTVTFTFTWNGETQIKSASKTI